MYMLKVWNWTFNRLVKNRSSVMISTIKQALGNTTHTFEDTT